MASSALDLTAALDVREHTHSHMHANYLEEPFEHDVYDLVLLIDVVQLHQVLERVQLIFPLGLKQPLV